MIYLEPTLGLALICHLPKSGNQDEDFIILEYLGNGPRLCRQFLKRRPNRPGVSPVLRSRFAAVTPAVTKEGSHVAPQANGVPREATVNWLLAWDNDKSRRWLRLLLGVHHGRWWVRTEVQVRGGK